MLQCGHYLIQNSICKKDYKIKCIFITMLLECQGSTLSRRKISLVRLKRIMLALTKQQLLTYIETRFRVLNLISRMLNYHHGKIGRNLNKYFQLLFAPKPLCSHWDLCGYILRLYIEQYLIK